MVNGTPTSTSDSKAHFFSTALRTLLLGREGMIRRQSEGKQSLQDDNFLGCYILAELVDGGWIVHKGRRAQLRRQEPAVAASAIAPSLL